LGNDGGVDAADPLVVGEALLAAGIDPQQWRRAQEVAVAAIPLDARMAADLFVAASGAAGQAGEAVAAIRAARSGMRLYARVDAGRAAAAAEQAIALLEAISDEGEWLSEASSLQNDMTGSGVVHGAVEFARSIVSFAARLPPSPEARGAHGQSLVNLASALIRAGHHGEALKAADDAARIAPGDAFELVGNIEYARGLAHAEMNEIGDARAAYARSRHAFVRAGSDPVDLAYLDRHDAAALARSGRSEEALETFERAAAAFQALGLQEEVDRTSVGIVKVRHELGKRFTEDELDAYEAAAERLSPSESVAMALNLANVVFRQGDIARADRLYRSFSTRARDLGMHIDLAKFDSSYAVALRGRGEVRRAIELNRSAAVIFAKAGMKRELANADNNYALFLEERALTTTGTESVVLRHEAADTALAAVRTLDDLRHSLPEPADRRALQLHAYPHVFTVAIAACFRVGRFDQVAGLVEKARIQPVLKAGASGFVEPSPVAARPGGPTVGGAGTPVVLAELCERQMGSGSAWLGWWSDGRSLVRARSELGAVDADSGPLDRRPLEGLAAALPVVTEVDLAAADGDRRLARRVAIWRAARAPLLNSPGLAMEIQATLLRRTRARVEAYEVFGAARSSGCDRLLWPLSEMLFADRWRSAIVRAHTTGRRLKLVVAPPALLGRVPWAALPLSDPEAGPPLHLVDAVDLLVGLPAALAIGLGQHDSSAVGSRGGLVVADSLGNLPHARRLAPHGMTILGAAGESPATRKNLLAALRDGYELLVISSHVRPGSPVDPASSSLLLAGPDGGVDPLSVAELAELGVPAECVILGCDGAGAATGTEWTGLATGFVWAGARVVVATTVPVIEDSIAAERDAELIAAIRLDGAVKGLLTWQRAMAHRWRRDPENPAFSPYRWAATVALRSGT
jgi:tetratricopeptide (TPR) repeat protein